MLIINASDVKRINEIATHAPAAPTATRD
jgi:hypothetical protein